MKVSTILNNNALLITLEDGSEAIVRGKGLGFKFKKNDAISNQDFENLYVLASNEEKNQYSELIDSIAEENIQLAEEIINFASKKLDIIFPLTAVVGLADHISFALERFQKGLVIQNALSIIVSQIHPTEYEIGKYGLHLIRLKLGIDFPEEEASNIAMHIVNYSQSETNLNEVVQSTKAIKDIVNIVRYHFMDIELDTTSLAYSRFLTHLQFFVQRIVSNTYFDDGVSEIYDQIESRYPSAMECSGKISDYIQNSFRIQIGKDELVYLALHINKLLR